MAPIVEGGLYFEVCIIQGVIVDAELTAFVSQCLLGRVSLLCVHCPERVLGCESEMMCWDLSLGNLMQKARGPKFIRSAPEAERSRDLQQHIPSSAADLSQQLKQSQVVTLVLPAPSPHLGFYANSRSLRQNIFLQKRRGQMCHGGLFGCQLSRCPFGGCETLGLTAVQSSSYCWTRVVAGDNRWVRCLHHGVHGD